MENRRPLIVDVRRGSLEDGPGIRTVVFFKGCPLRCVFCHNPEAQEPGPELAFDEEHCLRCGACVEVCPLGALDLTSPSRLDRDKCDLCGRCADACPGNGLRLIGRYWPLESLVNLLLRDAAFYRHSGGGVTLSGGECTMFPEYLKALLSRLKSSQVHVALETSGFFDYELFAQNILPYVDLILFDLKLMDRASSLRYLAQPNERILDNLRRLLATSTVEIRPRVPLVPGITDSCDNLGAIVDYLSSLGAKNVSLLPYNPLGLTMYSRLGRPTPDVPPGFTKPEREKEVIEMFRAIIGEKGCPPAPP